METAPMSAGCFNASSDLAADAGFWATVKLEASQNSKAGWSPSSNWTALFCSNAAMAGDNSLGGGLSTTRSVRSAPSAGPAARRRHRKRARPDGEQTIEFMIRMIKTVQNDVGTSRKRKVRNRSWSLDGRN